MCLRGAVVGTVAATTPSLTNDIFSNARKLLHWLEDIQEHFTHRHTQEEDRDDPDWNTTAMGSMSAVSTCTPPHPKSLTPLSVEHLTHYQRTRSELPRPATTRFLWSPTTPTATWVVYDKIWLYAIERCVFITDLGIRDMLNETQALAHAGL